jgi:hypothetical protein
LADRAEQSDHTAGFLYDEVTTEATTSTTLDAALDTRGDAISNTTSEETSDVEPWLLCAGAGGARKGRLLLSKVKCLRAVEWKYEIDILANYSIVNRFIQRRLGRTSADLPITISLDAHENEVEQTTTLLDKKNHVWQQLMAGVPHPDPDYEYDAAASWAQEAVVYAEAWWKRVRRHIQ